MNYRHAYHAGNHADVFKHIVLARVLSRLTAKDKPVTFLDAHAGIGFYDLMGAEAGKTLEWETGIAKLIKPMASDVENLIEPYRQTLAACNGQGAVLRYPGSAAIAAHLLRPGDRMSLNELQPQQAGLLKTAFDGDSRVRVTQLDAISSIKALLPLKSGRAMILLDPPYEQADEVKRAIAALREVVRRMPTAVAALWYPIKEKGAADEISAAALQLNPENLLRAELLVREPFAEGGLAGSGMLLVNAPWQTDEDLHVILPALASRLGLGGWGRANVAWLKPGA